VAGLAWPDAARPVAFFNVGGDRQLETKSYSGSKYNPTEAAEVARLVHAVLQARDVPAEEIAVITPYAGQVRDLHGSGRCCTPGVFAPASLIPPRDQRLPLSAVLT